MTPLRKAAVESWEPGVLGASLSGQAAEELCSSTRRALGARLPIALKKETEVWSMLRRKPRC